MSWIMIRRARQKDALIEDVEFVDAVGKVKIYLAEDKGLMKTGGGGGVAVGKRHDGKKQI